MTRNRLEAKRRTTGKDKTLEGGEDAELLLTAHELNSCSQLMNSCSASSPHVHMRCSHEDQARQWPQGGEKANDLMASTKHGIAIIITCLQIRNK